MRFSRVTLVACLMVLLAILLASPSSGETSNRIESKKMLFDEEANPDNMTTDVERKSIKADKKADDKEEKSDVKSKKTDGESKMTDGESKKTDGESKKTGGKSKKSKKDKKSKKAEKAKSSKNKSKKSPVNPTGNDKRISSFDASSIAGFVGTITCGELKLNTFKDVDVTRCLCDDKSCPCVMSSRFPCMCTNCEPTPPGGDFFNCLGCSCLEFP